jgi:hypothetical protein
MNLVLLILFLQYGFKAGASYSSACCLPAGTLLAKYYPSGIEKCRVVRDFLFTERPGPGAI